MACDLPESISVPTIWVGLEDAPIQMANAFIDQAEQQVIILSFGQCCPPIITADTPKGDAVCRQRRLLGSDSCRWSILGDVCPG